MYFVVWGKFFCITRYSGNISQSIETILPGPVQVFRYGGKNLQHLKAQHWQFSVSMDDDDVLKKRSRLPAP